MGKVDRMEKQCTNDVGGVRRVGVQRNGSEEVDATVAENRIAFQDWLQIDFIYDMYRARRAVVQKKMDWRCGERLGNDCFGER